MLKVLIVYGSVAASLMFPVGNVWLQEFTGLPPEGAPLAQDGPYEVVSEAAYRSPGHVVFRPADLDAFPREDALPVMVWANGGCASDSTPYTGFLTTIASHGFLVLATAPVEGEELFPTGDSAPTGYDRFTFPLRAALDWAQAEAAREGSRLEGRVATDRMAAMGLSCGGGLAVMMGADPRIGTIGVFNSAAWGSIHIEGDPRTVHIDRLHGAVLLVYGQESVTMTEAAESFEAIDHVPVFYGARRDAGHLGTFDHPGGGEFANVASSWLKWTLKDDADAGAMFLGESCGLCANPNWEVRSKMFD